MALLIWFSNFHDTLPNQGNFRQTGHFSGPHGFSAARLASFCLIHEIRTSSGYPFSMSSCFTLSSSQPNLVLEHRFGAWFWTTNDLLSDVSYSDECRTKESFQYA